MRHIYKSEKVPYMDGSKKMSLKMIGDLVREGVPFEITNEYGQNITKATLVKIAFWGALYAERHAEDNSERYQMDDILTSIMSEDALMDIICEGGIHEYMSRHHRQKDGV